MSASMEFLNHIHNKAAANQELIRGLIGKTEDIEFEKLIFKQAEEYKRVQDKSAEFINDEFGITKMPGRVSRSMTRLWNAARTISDNQTEQIASIIVKTSKSNIHEMTKMLNQYDGGDTKVLDIAGMYINAGEKTVDKLQRYLN